MTANIRRDQSSQFLQARAVARGSRTWASVVGRQGSGRKSLISENPFDNMKMAVFDFHTRLPSGDSESQYLSDPLENWASGFWCDFCNYKFNCLCLTNVPAKQEVLRSLSRLAESAPDYSIFMVFTSETKLASAIGVYDLPHGSFLKPISMELSVSEIGSVLDNLADDYGLILHNVAASVGELHLWVAGDIGLASRILDAACRSASLRTNNVLTAQDIKDIMEFYPRVSPQERSKSRQSPVVHTPAIAASLVR